MPRRILPGATWFLTRRTTRRHFLLRPDEDESCQRIYWYTTSVIAKKFGIVHHAVQVLSTHIHEVVSDPFGNLPAFIRERNRALANALKCHRKWPEEVFQRAPASCVELYGVDAIIEKIAYTIANCVSAGLVESPEQWPGARTIVNDLDGKAFVTRRPEVYFDPENPVWPAEAKIQMMVPELVREKYDDRAIDVIRESVERAVSVARAAVRATGRSVSSIWRLVSVPFTKRSNTYEPYGAREPHFATSGDRVRASIASAARHAFLRAYRVALNAWRAGDIRPNFPLGSWRWPRELLQPAKISMSVGSTGSTE